MKKIFSSFVILSLASCVSTGPIQTQIDENLNPVVEKPKEFQSPFEAIEKGYAFLRGLPKAKPSLEVRELVLAVKTIVDNQSALEKELSSKGELLLKPGHSYSFNLESFCVHGGKERPLVGDGLHVGPIKGAPSKWLPQILTDFSKRGISQENAQRLIWALLAGSKYDELAAEDKVNLKLIFPDAALRFGNGFLEEKAKSFLWDQLPSEATESIDRLRELRSLIQDSTRSFKELEEAFAPLNSRSSPQPVGWLKTPQGYLLHLTSQGYSEVKADIYVPETSSSSIFRPSDLIALPAQGQRLAISPNTPKSKQAVYDPALKRLLESIVGRELTSSEIDLIKKHPVDALEVFLDQIGAYKKTREVFGGNFADDESDAFRHFHWSSKVTSDIGSERAKQFLDAHEDFPTNSKNEKNMDLSNNQSGRDFVEKYIKENGRAPTSDEITARALELLREKELIVLSPSGKIPQVRK